MDHLKSIGIKAFIWDFSGKLATHGMGFIVTIFLARLLYPADFGLIAMIMVIVGIAQIFADIGLGGALIQRRKVLQVHYSSVFYFNILIGAILTLVTFFSAPWIAGFYNNQQLVLLVQIMSLSFITNAFSSVQNTKLRKELNYAALTKTRFIASLLSGIIGISLAFYGVGVWSLVAQILSMEIIYNILIWTVSKWTPSLLFSFKALKQLWGFGFRMFLASLLDAIFTRLDFIIIGKLFSPATLGYFQRAKSLNQIVVRYSSESLMTVLFPVLSKIQNDLPRLQNITIKMMGLISFIVFMLIGGLYVISEELVVLLFGDKWLQSVSYFQILIISGFAFPVSSLLINILSSRGNSRTILRIQVYKNIIFGINLYVGFIWGIEGYLYGLIIVRIMGVMINITATSHEISLPSIIFIKPIVTQAIVSTITSIITMYTMVIVTNRGVISLLILKVSLFTSVYFLINWIFKTSSYRDFMEQGSHLARQTKCHLLAR